MFLGEIGDMELIINGVPDDGVEALPYQVAQECTAADVVPPLHGLGYHAGYFLFHASVWLLFEVQFLPCLVELQPYHGLTALGAEDVDVPVLVSLDLVLPVPPPPSELICLDIAVALDKFGVAPSDSEPSLPAQGLVARPLDQVLGGFLFLLQCREVGVIHKHESNNGQLAQGYGSNNVSDVAPLVHEEDQNHAHGKPEAGGCPVALAPSLEWIPAFVSVEPV